jgi:hypothetical protein
MESLAGIFSPENSKKENPTTTLGAEKLPWRYDGQTSKESGV